MADPTLRYGTTPLSAMNPQPTYPRDDLTASMGKGVFGPNPTHTTLADIELEKQQALNRIAGLGAASAPRLQPPPEATKSMQPGPGIYYSPGLDRFSVGDIEFGREDYDVALQAAQVAGKRQGQPTTPGDWQRISPVDFQRYMNTISEGRGILGDLGVGAQTTGEAVVGGIGRGLQIAGQKFDSPGLAGAGEALVGAGEAIGLSPAEEARSAAIYQRQTPVERFGTALTQSLPSLAASVIPGIGGAGLAVRLGATAGGLAARAAAAGGAFTTVFPMHTYGSWEAAERNPNLDTSDPEVQTEILMSALTKTGVDLLGQDFAMKGLSSGLRKIVSDNARKSTRLKRALGAGAAEGTAELLTEVIDQIVFDEDSRAALSRGDWAAIWPVLTQKYGEQNLMALGVGAVLGGALGAVSGGPKTAPTPQRDLTGNGETDVLNPQVAPSDQAPLALPAPTPQVAPSDQAPLALPAPTPQAATLALPAPTNGGTVIPPAPFRLGAQLPPTLQLTPEQRIDTPVSLLPQQRSEPGQVEMFTPTEMGIDAATQARLTGQQLVGAPRPEAAALPEVTQADLETAGQQRMELTAQPTAMGEQINQLQQQMIARQQAQAAAQAEQEAQAAQEATQRTQRENQLLRARREQVQLEEDTNILGEELVGGDFNILSPDARADWDAAVAALDPDVRADVLTGEPTTFAGNQAQAELAQLGAALRSRRSNKLRRQAAEPPTIIEPTPAKPTKPAPRAARPKGDVAAQARAAMRSEAIRKAQETGKAQPVSPRGKKDADGLTIHEVATPDGEIVRIAQSEGRGGVKGWHNIDAMDAGSEFTYLGDTKAQALATLTKDTTPTPPTPTPPKGGNLKRGKKDAVQKQGAKAGTLRKGPKAGKEVRGEDTQGQETTGAPGEGIFEQAEAPVKERVTATPGRGLSQAEREAAARAERASDLLIGRDRRQPAQRTKEQIEADRAKEEAARAEAERRTEVEAAARREAAAAEAAVEVLPATLAAKSQAQLAWEAAQEQDPDINIDYEDLTADIKQRWAKSKQTAISAKRFVKPLLEAQAVAEANTGTEALLAEAEAQEELLLGAKRRKALDQSEIDAGIELMSMRDDKESPTAVRRFVDQVLARHLTNEQFDTVTKAYQRRYTLAQLNGGEVDAVAEASAELADMIAAHNADPLGSAINENRFVQLMRVLSKEGRENTQAVQLLDYTRGTADMRPNKAGGKIVPRKAGGKIVPRKRGLAAATSLENYNTLDGMVSTDGKDIRPMPVGKLKLAAKNFVSKLKVRPKVHVFANQADLKRKDPALYARAAAARPQGDFDTVPAAGYFFGGNDIIVFSDRIANSGHLNTVLAHETMGHFGLRAIIGEARFNQVMEGLYTRSPREAKELIDRAVAARGMSRAEATEEYLSDYAARIEISTLTRWWNAIKDALNKLGLRFRDDDARYLMAQARRYVKNGDTSSAFDAHVMALQNHAMANGSSPNGTGRFSQANSSTDLFTAIHALETAAPRPRTLDGALENLEGALGAGKRLTGSAIDIFDAVKKSVFSPTVWRAIRNEGFQKGMQLIKQRYDIARRVIVDAESLRDLALNPQVELGGYKFGAGLSARGREIVGFMLKANRIGHAYKYKARRDAPQFFVYNAATDTYVRQDTVIEQAKAAGRYTREQYRNGITLKYQWPETMTDAERTRLTAERDAALANIPEENTTARRAVERKYNKRINDTVYMVEKTKEVQHDFSDKEWDAFNQELDAMADVTVQWLESHLTRFREETQSTYRTIAAAMNAPMTEGDRNLIDRFVQRVVEITTERAEFTEEGQRIASSLDTQRAQEFIRKMNEALLGQGTDRIDALFAQDAEGLSFLPEAERAELTAAIKDFRTRYTPPEPTAGNPRGPESFVVQSEVRQLADQLLVRQDAETSAVQTLETGYVPFVRPGDRQVRVIVRGEDGRELALSERYRQTMPYFRAANRAEGEAIQKLVQAHLNPDGNTRYEVEVFDPRAENGLGGYVITTAPLEVVEEQAISTGSADPELNLNESIRFMRRFNINLDPTKSEQIIRALTTQNDRALLRQLQATFTPGAENDLTSAISQHIESRASTIARNKTSVALGQLLDRSSEQTRLLWSGDPVEYQRRKDNWERISNDPNASEDPKAVARREFDEYHSWFETHKSQREGNKYYGEFRQLVDFLDQQKNVLETDLAASKTVSNIQMWTSISFLMGSIASGGINLVGMQTNVLPALMSYNPKNAFGGGFGTKGAAELYRSIKSAGMGGKFDTSKYWRELSDAELQRKGISRAAADFIATGIDGGFLQAAQTNALMGTARGRMRSGAMNKAIMTAMLPFNWTEQASRRASALAAFNLEYDRQIAAGVQPQAAADAAALFAENLVDSTLGNYTTAGRPTLFRGGPQQFLFMFKMFPVNSAALLRNLPPKGQLIMLGSLLLLSGWRGIPFGEDIEDIVDTLAQKLGLKMGSVRREMIELGDTLYPGLGKVLTYGAITELLGGTDIGARTGVGNILPGSSMFLAGADTMRELEEFGGPMTSFVKYGALTVGNVLDFLPGGAPGDIETLLREQPISIVRAIGDAIAYQRSGAIVDKRGYVISDDFDASTALVRILGFYPKAASDKYELVRMDMREIEYQKAIKLAFRDKIVKAKSRGDSATVNQLYRDVAEWNRTARGTGLEITGLRDSVNRAMRSQRMTATERFSAAQSRAARQFMLSTTQP